MSIFTKTTFLVIFSIISIAYPSYSQAKFGSHIKIFENYDAENTFPKNAILFVGSSSINRWKTADSFPDLVVINRGFGGSKMSDLLFHYDSVVKKYNPKTIVLYCGTNDISANSSVESVIALYKNFFENVAKDLPSTKIIVIANIYAPRRKDNWDNLKKLNQFLLDYKGIKIFDPNPLFVDKDGNPIPNMYVEDKLHLSPLGYKTLSNSIRPLLNN